jgi:hypothetical protein
MRTLAAVVRKKGTIAPEERADNIARFTNDDIRQAVINEIVSAVQAERDSILSKANDLEFSPSKWSDLLEYISGDMWPTKAQA